MNKWRVRSRHRGQHLRQHLRQHLTQHLGLALWALVLMLSSAGALAQPDFNGVTARMQGMLARNNVSGASLLLVRDGVVLYERSFGSFDLARNVPIASASKWLMAGAIARLVDSGAMRWDDRIERWMPTAPADKRAITVRQLLSHSSGLRDVSCLNDRTAAFQACVDSILAEPLRFAPGSAFAYGGSSMHVAGRMAELATGKSWDQLFQDEITRPLAMSQTDFAAGLSAPPYQSTSNPRVAGGARSVLRDYGAFVQMLAQRGVYQGQRILSASSIDEMARNQVAGLPVVSSPVNGPEYQGYGLGQWLDRKSGDLSTLSSSRGAFGFAPWVDRETRMGGVLLVLSSFGALSADTQALWDESRAAVKAVGSDSQAVVSLQAGYGSGSFPVGSTQWIAAEAPTLQRVFSHWEGDVAVLKDPLAWHTSLVVPPVGVALRAVFKPLAGYTVQADTINGSQVRYVIPAARKGVVLRFHGTGGSAAGQFINGTNQIMGEHLLGNGYGVITLDSVDRVNRQWNAQFSQDNPDVRNVQQLLTSMKARGLLRANEPIFGQGTSNGGGFVSRVSALLNFNGQAIVIAAGIESILAQSTVPTLWSLSNQDQTIGSSGLSMAQRSFSQMRARGIAVDFNLLAPQPLYPEAFTQVRGLSVQDSLTLFTRVRATGALDQQGLVTDLNALERLDLSGYLSRAGEISGVLENAAAQHAVMTEFQQRMVFFFDSLLSPNLSGLWSVPGESGWGVNIAQQNQVLFPTWYTYDQAGRPIWYVVSGATPQADGAWAGDLFRFTGTPLLSINAQNAAGAGVLVGRARLFGQDAELVLEYAVDGVSQSKRLSRFSFGAPRHCRSTNASRISAPNRSDTWWSPSEPGWGLNLDEQGEQIFLTWYSYATDGAPLWLTGTLSRQSDGRFVGTLNAPTNGVAFDRISGPATTFPVPQVGDAELRFINGERMQLSYRYAGSAQSKLLERFNFASQQRTECM